MSHSSYYAPLDAQLAESIRAKYRLLRSRRSKNDLHAVSQTSCEGSRMNRPEVNSLKTNHDYSESYRTKWCCPGEHEIGLHHLKANALHHPTHSARRPTERRSSGNRSEYRKRASNNRPTKHRRSSPYGHTLNGSTNLICESSVLLAYLAYLATLAGSLFIVNWVLAVNRILLPLVDRLQYRTFAPSVDRLAHQSAKIYRRSAKFCCRSTTKLIAAFGSVVYWIPFVCLMAWFELNDLFFAFLQNFNAFLVLYGLVFVLPLSIDYHRVFSEWQLFASSGHEGLSKTTRGRPKSAQRQTLEYRRLNLSNKMVLLGAVNKTVSLSFLCLIDYTLVRNGLRALQSARELSMAFLVESLVDNIMNYDQPKFNYLPEEEHLSVDKLNVLTFLTGFSLFRLTHSLSGLFFMGGHRFDELSISSDYKSKLRSYQNAIYKKRKESDEITSSFEGRFEFLFIALRPILFGSLSYAFLFATRMPAHLLLASLLLLCIGLAIVFIDLEIWRDRVDRILSGEYLSGSIGKLSDCLFPAQSDRNLACTPNRTQGRTSKPIRSIRLPNHLILNSLLELIFILCFLGFIGPSALFAFTLIVQLAYTYLKFKRKLYVPFY